MGTNVCVLASGSSGNCTLIHTDTTTILIDAGLPGKVAVERLLAADVHPSDIDAILITHEHTDHVSGLGTLSRALDIPVYASEATWKALDANPRVCGPVREKNKRVIAAGELFNVKDLAIQPFPVPHDAAGPLGYCIIDGARKVGIATDAGHATQEMKQQLADCDLLVIEANHDVEMLMVGSYPWALKRRILSDLGHLSNEAAGEFLGSIVTERTSNILLAHLSKENNLPELALLTVIAILRLNGIAVGKDLRVGLTYRNRMTRPIKIEKGYCKVC
ncbi:MAG TPA: MBL fold metallo-hydrolase [Firmicutes bacterium]|nr:MBL fold metallo-hydrolase [Bacillota bacterium]